ncbi:hypothetical protein FRB95_013063 [Tulasnella sp. JGI-2019a]|nr:hypothetical protein FRB93_010876 [Tulasnella sp. JGI-2019a]KAG9023469.1 hypothetical protein FRB95_013063 [Tulasnella sp. JGI-2019a]
MEKKVRGMTSANWGVVAGISNAVHTCGGSLAGTAYSGRNRYITKKKLQALKFEWNSRFWLGEFRTRKRDVIGPSVIGLVTMGIGLEVGSALTHAGSHVFDQVASAGAHHALSNVAPHAHHVVGATMNNSPPDDLLAQASAGGHGFVRGVEQTFEVLADNTQQITASAAGVANHGTSYVTGEAMGIHTTRFLVTYGACVAIDAAGERIGRK